MVDKSKRLQQLQAAVVNVSRVHFWLVLIFTAQIIIYDAWALITPETVLSRWIALALLLAVSTIVWYLARVIYAKSVGIYTGLVALLVVGDIAFASFNVYSQRGMASRAVALYALPIIISAVLNSRAAILATAALSIAAYASTAISYFVLNFNEGYTVELYGEVGFYSALFLVLAYLMWAVIRPRK